MGLALSVSSIVLLPHSHRNCYQETITETVILNSICLVSCKAFGLEDRLLT